MHSHRLLYFKGLQFHFTVIPLTRYRPCITQIMPHDILDFLQFLSHLHRFTVSWIWYTKSIVHKGMWPMKKRWKFVAQMFSSIIAKWYIRQLLHPILLTLTRAFCEHSVQCPVHHFTYCIRLGSITRGTPHPLILQKEMTESHSPTLGLGC